MNPREPVVTGLGCLAAGGAGLETVWAGMLAGRVACGPPVRFAAAPNRRSPVFEIGAGSWTPSRLAPGPDSDRTLCLEFLLIALEEALGRAGLRPDDLRGRRIGVCLGTTVGCTLNDEAFYRAYKKGERPGLPAIRRFLDSNPAVFLAGALDLRGPVSTIANACASGTDAIGQAAAWIAEGLCEAAIAGGVDELSRIPYLGFSSLLNTSASPCRPFDAGRDGLNLGEGAGILILESRAEAGRRGASPLAVVGGYGCSADAYHVTAPHPDGAGLERALRQALAGRDPAAISFVNAHGTATVPNDAVEGQVLARVFGPGVTVVGTKGYTGHALGAAGGLEAVFTVQGLGEGVLPATAGFQDADPACLVVPTRQATEARHTFAVSTSLAFGGGNAAVLFEVPR
ncbi:MAG: beta-ketoacyl-[acyl-carrier-protein] synthase family protein [Acidobacteriota bacterium]|nr:beta-ketoacyl-[acyl-carrier-protein] synthase family protein [Acidobacteriota bacterium]